MDTRHMDFFARFVPLQDPRGSARRLSPIRLLPWGAPLLLLVGCQDQGVTAFNANPVAFITSHAAGDAVYEGYSTAFRGSVSDPDHGTSDLLASWYLASQQVCPPAPPDSEGVTTCEAVVQVGDETVTLEVHDPQDAVGSATVDLTIMATESPESNILSPVIGGVYYSDQKITFQGLVEDAEDDPTALTARWVSDIDGDLSDEVDAVPDSNGEVSGYGYLSEGEHALELRVEDSTGKSGTDSVIIDVGPPNSAPTCQISAPTTGSVGEQGDQVVFEAQVADVDVAADWLTVSWESDKDGPLGTSTPYSSGDVQFTWSDLSVDSHTITMTVTDEVGATCTDGIIYTVGTAPQVAITSPLSGTTCNEGDTITFSATVSDNEDSPTDLALSWESNMDGVLSTQGADSAGAAVFNISTLSAAVHDIALTVTDNDGLYSTALVYLTVNAVPTAPTVVITPDPAYTNNDLVAVATGSTDPDGSGTVTYDYAWYESGLLSTASTSAIFPSSATTKDLVYSVVVTPSDGTGDGEPGEASITVSNSVPVITTPSISPSSGVTTSETLICSATASDTDGDTPTLTWSWSDATGALLGTSASLTLLPSTTAPGDVVTCAVTATDDVGASASASASVTVVNSAPVISSVAISPSSGVTTSSTLTCSAASTDADGGTPTISYAWSRGGVIVGSADTLSLDPTTFAPGDVVTCTATASDADGGSDSASVSVTVDNSAPSITSATISPDPAFTGDTLTCAYSGFTDPDGDADASTIAWTVGGSSVGSGSTLSTGFTGGDTVVCIVTPCDGVDVGTPVSASRTISNSAPSIDAVAIYPTSPSVSDTLYCSYTGFLDADGDSDVSTYAWTVDGLAAGSDSTLSGVFAAGDTVVCSVTPSDGQDAGTALSASVVIQNTPPVITSASLAPSAVYTDDTLTASVSSYDEDGDTVVVSLAWYVDGALVSETGDMLDGATFFDKGQEVYLVATPNDGTVVGTPVSTAPVTVSNTPPTAPTISLAPTEPVAGSDDLVCVMDTESSDDDGDTVSYSFTWTVDGVAYTAGGAADTADTGAAWTGPLTTTWTDDTVPAEDTFDGEVWTCTVVPDDGEEEGEEAEAEVTIGGATSSSGTSMYMKVTWFLDGNWVEVIPTGFTGSVVHLWTWWGNHSIRMDIDNDGVTDYSHPDTYPSPEVDHVEDLDYPFTDGFALQDYYLWMSYWYDDTHGAVKCWAADCSYDPWGAGATFLIDNRDFACDANVWTYAGVQVSSSPIYCRQFNTCGDGSVEGDEECDDYNRVDGDGCDSECLAE